MFWHLLSVNLLRLGIGQLGVLSLQPPDMTTKVTKNLLKEATKSGNSLIDEKPPRNQQKPRTAGSRQSAVCSPQPKVCSP